MGSFLWELTAESQLGNFAKFVHHKNLSFFRHAGSFGEEP
jgi:hypothetical protein